MKNTNYMAIIPQSHEEKLKMYMKLPKKELAEMLIQANLMLDTKPFIYVSGNPYLEYPDYSKPKQQ